MTQAASFLRLAPARNVQMYEYRASDLGRLPGSTATAQQSRGSGIFLPSPRLQASPTYPALPPAALANARSVRTRPKQFVRYCLEKYSSANVPLPTHKCDPVRRRAPVLPATSPSPPSTNGCYRQEFLADCLRPADFPVVSAWLAYVVQLAFMIDLHLRSLLHISMQALRPMALHSRLLRGCDQFMEDSKWQEIKSMACELFA